MLGKPMNQQVQNTLAELHRGQQVTVIYDDRFEHEQRQVTGRVECVDFFWETL